MFDKYLLFVKKNLKEKEGTFLYFKNHIIIIIIIISKLLIQFVRNLLTFERKLFAPKMYTQF